MHGSTAAESRFTVKAGRMAACLRPVSPARLPEPSTADKRRGDRRALLSGEVPKLNAAKSSSPAACTHSGWSSAARNEAKVSDSQASTRINPTTMRQMPQRSWSHAPLAEAAAGRQGRLYRTRQHVTNPTAIPTGPEPALLPERNDLARSAGNPRGSCWRRHENCSDRVLCRLWSTTEAEEVAYWPARCVLFSITALSIRLVVR